MTGPPPNDPDAEAAILGSLLDGALPADVAEELFTTLEPEHFYSRDRRLVFAAVREVHHRDGARDVALVRRLMEAQGTLQELPGGPTLLTDLLGSAGLGLAAPAQARLVVELSDRRRAMSAAQDVLEAARDGREDWRAPVGRLEELLEHGPTAGPTSTPTVPGGQWVADAPAGVPAVWGTGGTVAWAEGEPTFLVGPPGVGKTTVAQGLILARIGVTAPVVLGLDVAVSDAPVLYVAADRPRQAQRSLARMVGEGDRPDLDARLLVHPRPLPRMLTEDPTWLARWATSLGVGTVILDSLKDVASDITKDEGGNKINLALQHLVGAGIDVMVLHHQRKAGGETNRKPTALADVYGSTLITAGAGSVLLLWGDPGDPIVELSHLKQPAIDIGPMRVAIDHEAGRVELVAGTDPLAVLRSAPRGIAVSDMARRLFGKDDAAHVEKARRKLEDLVSRGKAYRPPAAAGTAGMYFATAREVATGYDNGGGSR